MKKLLNFLVGTSFMLVFGAIDNLGLWIGVDITDWFVKSVIPMELDCVQYGMVGNTFSDMLAVVIALIVAKSIVRLIYLLTKIKLTGEGSQAQQFVGVTVGCLLMLLIYSIFAV